MLTFPYRVDGSETLISFPETDTDFDAFLAWLAATPGEILALDTETTGLNIYRPGFRCRLVQLGTATHAWVLDVERYGFRITAMLEAEAARGRRFVAHNAPFDLLVLDAVGLAELEMLEPLTFDTYILAHLIDPRSEADGAPGLGLKALSVVYVDPDAADTSKGLDAIFLKLYRDWTKTVDVETIDAHKAENPKRPHMAYGFSHISVEQPLYITYAGLDVIYTRRLLDQLGPIIRGTGMSALAKEEHAFQSLTTRLQRRGLRIDVPYTEGLVSTLAEDAAHHRARAAVYGVENVDAPRQVAAALLGMGERLTVKTDSGALSVKKEVLAPLADIDVRSWERLEVREPNPLADAVLHAKRSAKWGTAYAIPFLRDRDANDRIHPNLRSLAARTARMSVSNPPLQQLPSGDWRIRRAIIADPGHTIIAADYKSMELRVLAGLADVAEMRRAIEEGRDLHDYTATHLYGNGFTKPQRRLAKGVGLGKVFGGGATGLAQQIGAPLDQVKYAVARYDAVYPEVRAYGRRLQRAAALNGGEVVTPIGRHLPLDNDRAYAATNYVVQSTARDILAKALVAIDAAGLFGYVLLPVHDELVCQAPDADAADVIHEIGSLMRRTFLGVPIDTDTEVYGPSWGHGYGAPS